MLHHALKETPTAKFRNSTNDTLTVGAASTAFGGVVVEPGATFDVADELVLDEGHSHTDDCTHPHEARVYPASLFARAGLSCGAGPVYCTSTGTAPNWKNLLTGATY